jgi:hypothetical protein
MASQTSKHEELIGELETWSKAYRVAKDPYVAGLLDAMRTGEGLAAYAELNPVEYLPQLENRTDDRSQKIATYLTIIRNILVFFPVALTWIAVSKSTSAFATYVTANKGSVVNFLEFWQDGYGVLSRSWTIGHIAFLDFAVIMVVIALTLITAYMHQRQVVANKKHHEKVEGARLILGLKLHTYLFSQRAVSPLTMSANVSAAIKNLATASKAFEKASKVLQKDVNQIPSNKQVLSEVKRLVTGVKSIKASGRGSKSAKASKSVPAIDFDFDSYFPDLNK